MVWLKKISGKMLPLGVDRFEKLRNSDYYYIDKTRFIEELLSEQFEVNLITRPLQSDLHRTEYWLKLSHWLTRIGAGTYEKLRPYLPEDVLE